MSTKEATGRRRTTAAGTCVLTSSDDGLKGVQPQHVRSS